MWDLKKFNRTRVGVPYVVLKHLAWTTSRVVAGKTMSVSRLSKASIFDAVRSAGVKLCDGDVLMVRLIACRAEHKQCAKIGALRGL